MTGRAGLQVIAKGHLLTWKTKSLDPSLVVWWSGVNIFLGADVGIEEGKMDWKRKICLKREIGWEKSSLQYDGGAVLWVSRDLSGRSSDATITTGLLPKDLLTSNNCFSLLKEEILFPHSSPDCKSSWFSVSRDATR